MVQVCFSRMDTFGDFYHMYKGENMTLFALLHTKPYQNRGLPGTLKGNNLDELD